MWAGGFWATFTLGRVLAGLYAHRIRLNTMMYGAMALALAARISLETIPVMLSVSLLGLLVLYLLSTRLRMAE